MTNLTDFVRYTLYEGIFGFAPVYFVCTTVIGVFSDGQVTYDERSLAASITSSIVIGLPWASAMWWFNGFLTRRGIKTNGG